MKTITVALIGNPNCGKTTLFNRFTGSNQHVGNFPGVTVDKKEGAIKGMKDAVVVDLPGIYSLSPYSSEEVVTRDFLLSGEPDCILSIVDGTNIERNLYLTLQLMELGLPMVIALNMMDEVTASGGYIDVEKLEAELGVLVVPISASKNQGIEELLEHIERAARSIERPAYRDFCTGDVHRAIHATAHFIEDKSKLAGVPVRFAATKLLEGDEPMAQRLQLTQNERHTVTHIVEDMEMTTGLDREAAMAGMRYEYIDKLCRDTVVRKGETKEQQRSVKIDKLLTHRYLGIPIFLGIMLLIFWLTFGAIGAFLSGLMEVGVEAAMTSVAAALTRFGVNPVVESLIVDGIMAGVGSVLSFLPTIVVLFFFLSILEDTGYMARVAFIMDSLLRRIGLSGRSFVPMLIGFGCSVPAIMATRTLASDRDRHMTVLLAPFMSCSAKLPIYGIISLAFFPDHAVLVVMLLYLLGILTGVLYGLLLGRTRFKGVPIPFVMELPAYRLPSFESVMLHLWEKAKDFLTRAFTIIFMASIVIWMLRSFDARLNLVTDAGTSLLASISRLISPIFAPLGFSDWRAVTALVAGLSAKEAVVSTLSVLTGTLDKQTLSAALATIFTVPSAAAFLAFTLLYTPCVAAMAAARRELGGTLPMLEMVLAQCTVAWVVSFVVYRVALIAL